MADTKIKTSNIESLAVTHDKLHTDMDLTGKTVQVPTPTAASHPATKNYVDTEIASVTDFAYNGTTEVLTIDTADGSSFTADISGLASETYVNTAVSNLVDSAPGTLDTLNELAAALGDDANFATTVSTNLGNKVDKIDITGATVGSGTAIPVITYNAQGQITSATTTAVAGIDAVTFSNGSLTISTGDGSDYVTDFDARYFTETEANANFLGINAKATDSDLLDGLNSTQFLRSDANDTFTGNQLKLENSFPSAGGLLLVSDDGTSTTVATATAFRVTNNGGSGSYSVFESSSGNSDLVHYNNGVLEMANSTGAPILRLTAPGNEIARIELGDGSNYGHISTRPDLGDGILFYENGSNRAILRGGNFGIGTESPAAKTHIHGTGDLLRLTSTNTGNGGAQIDLIHETPSPADGDFNAMINMGGYYSGSSSAYASSMRSVWTSAGGRRGRLEFYTRNAGDFTKQFQIEHDGDIYSWRVNNWEPIVAGGFSRPSIAYTSSQSFDITPTYPTYSGVRTNSSKYKYFRLEADIRSTAADHYGFFWGADQANLGYNNGVAGYKWVYRGNNNRPEFRDINTNDTFKNMNAVSHAYNDGVFHRWVMEVLPTGVTLYADGVLVDYLPNNYVLQGYCGILTYSSGDTLNCRNVVITSLDSVQQEAVHYNTHSLAGAADGIYKMVNSQGLMQEVYVSNGWMLIAANDARSSGFPNGNSRQDLQYTVNRNGVQGHFGEPSPDNDYLIGGFIDDFSFNKIKVEAWGYSSTNSTYNYANKGDNASAEWSASSLTTVVPRSSVTIGGNIGIYTSAAYFNGDGIRVDYDNGGFSANYNQTTIGGVGVQGSSGDPTTGCYMGHGISETGTYSEGWYRASGTAADCQGYATWVKS